MNNNAKNELQELLQTLGHEVSACLTFETLSISKGWESIATVNLPGNYSIMGKGVGAQKKRAEIIASQDALKTIHDAHSELIVDWDVIQVDAQRGDALIKLAIYLNPTVRTANDKSKELQEIEKNSDLAKVFHQWKSQGDSDLVIWGNHLSEHTKATLIEALIWRRLGNKVFTKTPFKN